MSTIYVAPKPLGNDSNNGSSAAPFETIKKASSVAAGGDTIQIAAGTYHETDAINLGATAAIVPLVDGVTYTGDRGPRGDEWLTIIDPSRLVIDPCAPNPNAWTSELLNGVTVWKIKLGYEPGMLTYNGQCIECVGRGLMTTDLTHTPVCKLPYILGKLGLWSDLNLLPNRPVGLALLAQKNPTWVSSGGTLNHKVNFWDGPYALAAYDPSTESVGPGSGMTYIRLADNGDPNDISLRAAQATLGKKVIYGIDISGVSNTTIANLLIQGAYVGIRITVDQYNKNGNNNTIKNCHIQHGWHRILIEGDQAFTNPCTHDNEISFNTFTLNMFGYASPGAYPIEKANATYDLALKEWFYWFLKYIVGDGSTHDVAIKMGYCGANNRIRHNIFEKGAEGVFTYSCDDPQICCNTFRHMSDCGVLVSDAYQVNNPETPSGETVQCNQFDDVFQFIRYDSIDISGGLRTNYHYFLSNTGQNDPILGVIVHFFTTQQPAPSDPHFLPSTVTSFALTIAGNEFGPTGAVLDFTGDTTNDTTHRKGIPAVTISGNSFLSPHTVYWGDGDQTEFYSDKTMVGSFVNNRLVNDMGTPAWYDPSNRVI